MSKIACHYRKLIDIQVRISLPLKEEERERQVAPFCQFEIPPEEMVIQHILIDSERSTWTDIAANGPLQ